MTEIQGIKDSSTTSEGHGSTANHDIEYKLRLLKGKFGGDDNRMFVDLALEKHLKDKRTVGQTIKEFEKQGMMDDFSKMGWLDVFEVARTVLKEEEDKKVRIRLLKAVKNNPDSTTAKLVGLAGIDKQAKRLLSNLSEQGYLDQSGSGRKKYKMTNKGEELLKELS